MSRFQISELAKRDLRGIWIYISNESIPGADKLISEIIQRFPTLAKFPQMGRLREELVPALRSFVVGNYVIFYRPIDDGVEVIRVLHGAQDISEILKKDG